MTNSDDRSADFASELSDEPSTPESNEHSIIGRKNLSRLGKSFLSITAVAKQAGEVLNPVANLSAKQLSSSAKAAYTAATSEQAMAFYWQAGANAAKATSIGSRATFDAARKVVAVIGSEEAKHAYGKVGEAAAEAASRGAHLAGSAASLVSKVIKEPMVRTVAATVAATVVVEIVDQLGGGELGDNIAWNITDRLVNGLGKVDGQATNRTSEFSDDGKQV